MKAVSYRITLLGLLTIFLLPVNAQNISYSSSGGLKMGLGLGSSYQASDIKNSKGGGFDIWMGSPIYQRESAIFALDWRFRFLAGYNRAYDHRLNTDGIYNNIQLTHFNYDLELALTLNRLRERTGIILSGFIGAGVTHGITSADLLDAANTTYDYSSILPNRGPSEILADLDQLTDKNFETRLLNQAAILPTAGIYLGYEFSPRFALGLEHKMNFSLSENNSTFGIDIDNQILSGSSLDFTNYTSVVVKWALGGGSSGKRRNPAQDPDPAPAAVAYPPQVDITTPFTNPYESAESSVKVTARVLNITRKEDISVKLNGQNQDFILYSSINRIEINTNLQTGRNSLAIFCKNDAGSDSDDLILNYLTPSVKNPPELKFINPSPGIQVDQIRYPVQIRSNNIASRDDITLTANGKRVYDFDYDSNGIISFDHDLDEGRNEIIVSGRNADGTAEDRTNVTYVKPEQGFPPVVKILQPLAPRSGTYESRAEILAEISNVESRSDIFFRINYIKTNDFSFNPATKRLSATIPLNSSTSRIEISAQNKFGSDGDSRIITREIQTQYQPQIQPQTQPQPQPQPQPQTQTQTQTVQPQPVQPRPVQPRPVPAQPQTQPGESNTVVVEAPCITPRVTMNIQEVSVDNATHLLSARIQNVSIRDNVTLLQNGTRKTDFQFNPASGQVTATLNLAPGSHNMVIVGMNECGTKSESKTIIVAQPCLPPVVEFTISEFNSEGVTHRLGGKIKNALNKGQVTLTVNGRPDNGFRFVPATGEISSNLRFNPGSHTIVVSVKNDCGSVSESKTVTLTEPCASPTVSFTVAEVNSENATHQLSGRTQNVKNKGQVTLTVNGRPDTRFQFVPGTGEISRSFRFDPGSQTIVVSVKNECGSDSKSKTITLSEPCNSPSVSLTISEINSEGATHRLSGRIQNVNNKGQVTLTVDGRLDTRFQFTPATGEFSRSFRFNPGSHTIVVNANNQCGSDSESKTITVAQPCIPPLVDFTISEINSESATHQLGGKIQNVKNKSQVTLTVNGTTDNGFQFLPTTGEISNSFKLDPGTHTIVVIANNQCGSDSESKLVMVNEIPDNEPGEEENTNPDAGWVRINPGNASWEFCLQTPASNFNRDNLSKSDFSYSGTASSLYFKPIAGGGTASVNGKAFNLNPGQYYHFSGNLKVQVTNKHQGAMGHWSVYIESTSEPLTGKGNNRPTSPCETGTKNKNR